MEQVAGIRELKAALSRYLRQVKAGGTILITERGEPIGRIVPYTRSIEEQMEQLRQAGIVEWNGEPLQPATPVTRATGDKSVTDLLLEDRE